MKTESGTYAILLRTDENSAVEIGRWGVLHVRPGYYLYVGSAFGPGGVRGRVSRHCRESKSKHWHIDYLREMAIIESVWYSHSQTRLEHRWAKALAKWSKAESLPGFGCSDCNCDSHLFYFRQAPTLAGLAKTLGCCVESWSCEETRQQVKG
ncbi:GIY-YIG nuclease family protein [Candidatus Thiodiazotropha sp. CDECU1]|uniref:GIY-YIG nuclease family protein n=1 Tax=Candidatus Thiodiazotropha sp. CDECU1 TaxID=3065865 RepID=UPI00292F77FA|nr:GIY-YIG nuclease family protein [Candidatus Thiodiazotropha sp. CDECU1]